MNEVKGRWLIARFNAEPRCVKCGVTLSRVGVLISLNALLAPCCSYCAHEVKEEQLKFLPMWPSDWYGHWCKSSEGNIWVSSDK